jgi:hypothetical protein
LKRNSDAKDAITAAVRALANASTSVRSSPKRGSSFGTRNGKGSTKGDESPTIGETEEILNKES